MELIERAGFLTQLQTTFSTVSNGEGHAVFISGEAGIGKSSLVKVFCKGLQNDYPVYQGTCDALFTPRPLAPLYDILLQANSDLWKTSTDIAERTSLFTSFFQELRQQKKTIVIVFEDIHWADEATLDFIKFLARRITQLNCLFMLTYRDNEIDARHPLRNVMGQLPADSFTRIQLPPLSKPAVEKMAVEKGYNGNDVYSISGGNPFYVTEILASYSTGVPDNIKDAVLSVYNRQDDATKQVWELMSVIPAGLEIAYLEAVDPSYAAAIDRCLELAILVLKDSLIFFKHELYRRTIELSLSPLKRVSLNKKVLALFKQNFEQQGEMEKIIHHAKNANDYDLVVQYAPAAAKKAASVGAHIEACKLYFSAIEYYQGADKDLLIQLYESYAYECYLVNQTRDAIIYTNKALNIWKEKNNPERLGNSLRFLSRIWWYEGNRKNTETFAAQAIEVLDTQPASPAKAMALSNMSQLKMLSKEAEPCIFWGEKAIAMAKELNNEEILSHALNNVGSVYMKMRAFKTQGTELLQESLDIALRNGYHEHAARAYTNLSSIEVVLKNYAFAEKILDEGIRYCEERDLDSWTSYMSSWKSRLKLETGHWEASFHIAEQLLRNEYQPSVVKISALAVMATLKMRKGEDGVLPLLLEANTKAFDAMELQRIIPALVASLEYEWITGTIIVEPKAIDITASLIGQSDNFFETNEFAFWMRKARKQEIPLEEMHEGYDISSETKVRHAAAFWKAAGCTYDQALCLFEGNDDDKKEAISIVQQLGATAVYEKMKMEMRNAGIKSIPRGIRKTTQSNPAQLTGRELDILPLLKEGLQNKEIAARLFISAKTVDHHISSIFFKLDVNTRAKAVQEAVRLEILK